MTLTFIIQRMWVVHNMVDLGSYKHIVCNKEKTQKFFIITSEKTSPHVFITYIYFTADMFLFHLA